MINLNKSFSFLIVGLMMISLMGVVSASIPVCAEVETTFVSGVITDATNGDAPVAGADITVTCNGVEKHTTSNADGSYEVQYAASECDYGNSVSVSASYDGLNGNSETVDWYTENTQVGCLKLVVNVACANVPLVPEFVPVIAGLTVLGALGVFLVIRRN